MRTEKDQTDKLIMHDSVTYFTLPFLNKTTYTGANKQQTTNIKHFEIRFSSKKKYRFFPMCLLRVKYSIAKESKIKAS